MVLQGVLNLLDDPASPATRALLLVLFPLFWVPCCRWARRRDTALTALLLHLLETLAVAALLPALEPMGRLAWLVVLLAGPTALGGLRFLLPCALVLALFGAPLWPPDSSLETLTSALVLIGFCLALALVGFRQAQRLHLAGRAAQAQVHTLDLINARLQRYVPEPVRMLARAPQQRQAPDSCWVTVVFVDLVEFASLVRHRPAAEIVEVVDAYHAALDGLASRHGGVLGKFLGDGVLVYYPDHDSRAADAASCLALVRALPGLLDAQNDRWRRRGQLLELSHRAGIASGYCAVGDWGGEGRLDHTVIGDAVNLASRLQAAAEPGSALVSAATAALLEGTGSAADQLGPARCLSLRGFGDVLAFPLVDACSGRL